MDILMSFLLIVGICLVGYVLSGYAPGRVLKPKIAEIYFIGFGNRPIWRIRVDSKLPWWLSVIPLPWPFTHVWFQWKWKEIVTGRSKMNEKITTNGTEQSKFQNAETFESAPNEFSGTRDELVPSLRIYETVSYRIPIMSANKHHFDLGITIIIFMIDGKEIDVIRRPNFKLIAEIDLNGKIPPWALKKTTEDLIDTDANNLKDPEDGIRLRDGKKFIDLKKFLDSKFKPLGGEVNSMAIKLYPGKDALAYFKIDTDKADLIAKLENQEAFEGLRAKERITEINDAETQGKVAAAAFEPYVDNLTQLVKTVYQGEADVAAQRPFVLAEVKNEANKAGVTAIETLMGEISKATNKKASKERREEEANV